ncbi:LysR family transcriptional regulator [Ligilactobacillus aviarius]|uniref:Transcriptional regulator n=2 Tax=Lactobacillaceae TaxID=33958 RepID=A0A510WTW9_9LACO|nr:LysR family transcriptional regulator [Ligilactobacillus aviarius]KRM39202.1 transcriptional regulator, LysR family [Ligilactobacillus aviarius subsp. aviarius DSM 20655]GEK42646.1 transcriptional regulator [Ligilactobacillus aviarius]
MNLKQLEYFIAVAEEKQVTAAAKRLNIAQPPLSYQLKQLEKELGVQLLKRTAHGVQLTPAGSTLAEYAKQIVDLTKITEYKVKNIDQGFLGTLRIGATSTSGGVLPNDQAAELIKAYPGVKFELSEGNTYQLLDLLNKNLIDVAVLRTPFNREGLQVRMFPAEPMMAIIPERLLTTDLAKRKSISIEKLSTLPLIVYRRFKIIIKDSFEHRGLQPTFVLECDDARTGIRWAEREIGVALVPATCAQRYATSQVKLIPVRHEAWQTNLALVWKTDQQLSPVLAKFINCYKNDTINNKEKG